MMVHVLFFEEVQMDDKRKGEIALRFLKHKLRSDRIRLGLHTRREIGNIAKDIDISAEEAMEFVGLITRELVDEVFPRKNSESEEEFGGAGNPAR
jgi:hypothetical protein